MTNLVAKSTAEKKSFKDIYQSATDIIIEQLEAGTIPWQQPWVTPGVQLLGLPYNFNTKNKYNGVNIVLLWAASIKNRFISNEWASFKQWNEKNEYIRKGEKGNIIVYYDTFEKEIDGEIQKIPFIKTSLVFNRCQLQSYVSEKPKELIDILQLVEVIDPVDEFIENTQAVIEYHNDSPCYNHVTDKIFMPYREAFTNTATCTATEAFYSSLLHELVHWTGDKKRLNREGGKRFGDQQYAAEELVAEFGAAFLCAGFGLATVEKGDHAAYIDHWLKVIKENGRAIFSAASEASKAVEYLHGLKPSLTQTIA